MRLARWASLDSAKFSPHRSVPCHFFDRVKGLRVGDRGTASAANGLRAFADSASG
jgi:hypothetical protein